MNEHRSITAPFDEVTLQPVAELSAARRISREAFVAEAVRRVAETEADLAAFLKPGAEQIARNDFVKHEAFVANLAHWRKHRDRPR